MVLYSGTTCPFSQRCRFVLFEKGMDFEIRDIDLYNKPEDIANAVLFYASDAASYITGAVQEVAGGYGIPAPEYADAVKG